MSDPDPRLVSLTAEIVGAFVSHNRLGAAELPRAIEATYAAIAGAGRPAAPPVPAVSVRKSLASREHIVSLIDGKPYRFLKRHLARHGLSFEAYCERYQLPASYPSVAPAYSEQRSAMAVAIGLGRKPGQSPARQRKTR